MAETPIPELVTMEDLKQLIEENIALTKDTRRMLKRMRREALISAVIKTVVWAVLIIASFWLSAKFLEPYMSAFQGTQEGAATQDYGALFEQYKSLMGQ